MLEIKSELDLRNDAYGKALITYLGIFVDRIAVANTSFGVWHVGGEKLERIMGRQAIPMVFDFPESNPFCHSSGSALNQLDWIIRYVESECGFEFSSELQNATSGEKNQFVAKSITAVVTDPPYYDAIAYADLSDFFYVWLKRTLFDIYPLNFATPQTPKSEECTALKHHHSGNLDSAKKHFEDKLLEIFDAIEHQTSQIVSIMFAHQSTEAWSTLCNSILGSRMNITGSWANDTEMTGALKTDKSFLSSSVTVACKPQQRRGYADFKEVKKAIEVRVEEEVKSLYELGFRGPDLLTACFGQAVSEFGKYEKVEKSDGTEVSVEELLDIAKQSAFNSLLKGFEGDDFTKFYIGWLQLNGFAETDFDDAAKFTKVGLSIEVQELFKEYILIKSEKGNKQSLGRFDERIKANKNLGLRKDNVLLIDIAHRAMALHSGARKPLVDYIRENASTAEAPFWRVLTSISELAKGTADAKISDELLTNKDSLLRETKETQTPAAEQAKLFE
jgi:adenine-specific DNA methylase